MANPGNAIGRALYGERARPLAWLMVALYLIGLGISATLRSQGDFGVYYLAGQRAAAGAAIYPAGESDRFLYAPIFAIGFIPFGALARRAAQLAWFVVNAAALVALIVGAGRLLFGSARRLPAALIVIPLLLASRFVNNNIEHGQINIVTLALLVWAIAMAEGARPRLGGALLGVALLIKPFALLAAWYLLLTRRRAALAWSAACAAALIALPALFFGPAGALAQTSAYLRAALSMGARYRVMLTNQSATSAAIRLLSATGGSGVLSESAAFAAAVAFELVLLAAVTVWIVNSRRDPAGRPLLALCAIFCLMPSFAPISWKSYYLALLIPYMALVSTMWIDRPPQARTSATARTLLALSVLLNLAGGRRLNHLALFYSAHFVSSLLLLAALAAEFRAQPAALTLAAGTARRAAG